MRDREIIISIQTILVFLGIMVGVFALWLVRDIVLMLFISLILALTIEPSVEWMSKRGIPRAVGVISTVLLLVLLFIGVGSVAIFPLQQVSRLVVSLPGYLDAVTQSPLLTGYQIQLNDAIYNQLTNTTGNIITATLGAFSALLTAVVIIVFTVYILLDFDNLRRMFINLFAKAYQDDVRKVMKRIEVKLGGWLRGQIILMLIIGVATYVGLTLLGIDYALALAVIAGVLEIIPLIGPIISAIPALIVAFAISPIAGVFVLVLYLLIQQLENHLIVPKVMQRTVGVNPLVTIIVLMIGGKLLGLMGAILAIPIAIVVIEIIRYFLYENH